MFLTQKQFLEYFRSSDKISRDDFIDKFTVMYSKPKTLRALLTQVGKGNIIKSEDDQRYINREEIIDYFYEIVVLNREKYLSMFYDSYFNFQDPDTIKWKGVDLNIKINGGGKGWKASEGLGDGITGIISVQKNDESRRIIRNLFHRELLDYTKVTNTVKASVSFWQSLVNLFVHLKLEDRFFAPSSIGLFLREKNSGGINWNNLFYLFQAYQPKASIFNPYSICWTLDNIIPHPESGGKLFTPVLSWCSYLVAFMHSPHYNTYYGVDVMPSVCKKAEFLAEWYREKSRPGKKVRINCCPSERLDRDEYKSEFDTILVCPPYYDMEIYHEGEQSIDTFKTYDSWLDGYWRETVKTCYNYCKDGGSFVMIANDYFSLSGDKFPLTDDLSHVVVDAGFALKDVYYLQNRTSPLRVNSKDRAERLFIFRKGGKKKLVCKKINS
jgi:hypothetical protein